jgi:fibronectin-binding autotransporter adhesin
MKHITKLLLLPLSLGLSSLVQGDSEWDGSTGDWTSAGNWSNGIPGPAPADVNAYVNAGGVVTVQPATVVDTVGELNLRLGWTGSGVGNTVSWNPGAGENFVNQLEINDSITASSLFNHLSGTIRVDQGWFHVARRGDATYISNGTAELIAEDRISIGEGGGGAANGYVEMFGNAQLRTSRDATSLDVADPNGNSGNESFIAVNSTGVGTLVMNNNTIAESQFWRIANGGGSAGTVILNNNAQFRNRNNQQISLGRNGTGVMVANDASQIMLLGNGGGSLRVGDDGTGTGNLTLNDSSKVIGINGTNHHVLIGDDGNSKGTVTMNNNSGFANVRNVWIGNGGSSEGTVIMRNNSYLDNKAGGGDAIRIAQGGTASGTLLMFDQASIVTRNFGIDQNAGTSGGTATVVQNENSSVTVTGGWMEIGGGNADTSTYTLNNDSVLLAQGNTVVGMRSNGTGVMTINDNAYVESNAIGGNFIVGNGTDSNGQVVINDDGTLRVRNGLYLTRENNSQGLVQQNGGLVQVDNLLFVGRDDGRTGHAGTYNLDGGTLRVNDVRLLGNSTFNWGAGTLSMSEVNANNSILVTGSLTTGYATDGFGGNAASTLDLGDLYKDAGTKYDVLNLTGDLNLTSTADVLDFWTDVQHLRPGGGAGVELTGEIRLVGVTGTLSGTFENIIGPGEDGTFFRTWSPAEVATLGITGAADLGRNRGAVIYKADGVYFAYNISGQIPEPATGIFLLLGTALLRGVSVFRRNQAMRVMLRDIG